MSEKVRVVKEAPAPIRGGRWKQNPETGELVRVEGTEPRKPVAKRDRKK